VIRWCLYKIFMEAWIKLTGFFNALGRRVAGCYMYVKVQYIVKSIGNT